MMRPVLRTTTRLARPQTFHRLSPHARSRFISSTPPAQRSRSWKSSAARWGLAAAGIYWYSTTAVFAEEPAYLNSTTSQTATEDESLPTLDTIASARKQRLEAEAARTPSAPAPLDAPSPSTSPDLSMAASIAATEAATAPLSTTSPPPPQSAQPAQGDSPHTVATPAAPGAPSGSPAELEEEAEGEGAFNPETGEINWDCPCLGGMAHGPCGPEFREAFSCFVYSEQEPKGIDCIEKFKGMQDCFRSHPDVYGAELTDEVDEEDYEATQNATSQAPSSNELPKNSETGKEVKVAQETKVAQPSGTDNE